MARRSEGVSSLTRAVHVLDSFSVDAPFLALGAIAERAGLPLSTAHRLVGELVAHGLLERMPDRRYRVGLRLWELGSRTPGALGLRELALPSLHAVQSRVQQHTQLAVRAGSDVLVIERLSSRGAVINASVVGGRIPLHRSSSGVALLAHDDDAHSVDRVVAGGLEPATPSAPQDEGAFRAAVARCRRDGYAVAAGWIHPESRGVAAAIRGTSGAPVGAVGVVVPNDGSPAVELGRLVARAAEAIADALARSGLPSGHPLARRGGAYRDLVSSSEPSMEYFERLATGTGPSVASPPGGGQHRDDQA